jgi:hypothetical protein
MHRSHIVALTLLIAIVALAPAGPAGAQAPELDLDSYVRLLREARAAAGRGDRIDLEAAAAPLIAARSVRVPGDAVAPADNRWLAEALAAPSPDLPAISARLGALIDASESGPAPPGDARDRLERILSRPPFGNPEQAPREPGWLERFIEWLFGQIGDIAGPLAPAALPGGNTLAWVIAGLGGLLVLAVLLIWLRGLRGALAAPAARLDPDDPEAGLTAGTALEQASALARFGDYRKAVRYLYLSSLLWLDERGALRYERSLTNREYLARLGDKPGLRARLAPVIDTFDRVWYGSAPLDADSFAAYERQVRELRDTEAGK